MAARPTPAGPDSDGETEGEQEDEREGEREGERQRERGRGVRTSTVISHPAFEQYAGEAVPATGVGAPGKAGELALAFAGHRRGTRLVRDYARVPFHVAGTLDHDPLPAAETVAVQSPSGGIAQGDRHDVTVTVGEGAIAHVTTASATKVLSMDHNYGGVDVSLHVGPGGHLDHVPEPTILHADARYCQRVTVDLATEASAVVGEIVVPGRIARGECFDFERYASCVRVRQASELLVADDSHIHPADGAQTPPTAPGVLGELPVFGTLYVLAPARDAAALSDALHESVSDDDLDDRAGATALPFGAGVAVRALGHRADDVQVRLRNAWDTARRELVGAGIPDRRVK